jgi:hypothetical protein
MVKVILFVVLIYVIIYGMWYVFFIFDEPPRSMISATGSRGILQERCEKVTGSFRKTPEIAGTWKQYSDRKLSGLFPVDSCQLPVLSWRNRPEIIGKNPKIFRPEYRFHKITGVTRNRQFPDRVVRPGQWI